MLCDLVILFIISECIEIIEVCVKEVCSVVEKLIILGKKGDLVFCCNVVKILCNVEILNEDEII